MPPVELRPRAERQIEEAIDHYLTEAGVDVANQFALDLELVFALIAKHPLIGSRDWSVELGIEGVRSCSTQTFPYVVFYLVDSDLIDVIAVLHARSDIPNLI